MNKTRLIVVPSSQTLVNMRPDGDVRWTPNEGGISDGACRGESEVRVVCTYVYW